MNKKNFRRNQIAAALAVALLCMAGPVSGQDTSQRAEELEEALKSLTREIDALKVQVNENKEKTTAVQQKVDSSVPTPPTKPTPTRSSSSGCPTPRRVSW